MRRQVDCNAYSVFPHRATMMDMEENMMTRVMKPMRTTTTTSRRGNTFTQMLDKQKGFFSDSALFSPSASERFSVTSYLMGHHLVCTFQHYISSLVISYIYLL